MRLILPALAAAVFAAAPALSLTTGQERELSRAVDLRIQKKYEKSLAVLRDFARLNAADAEAHSEALYQEGLVLEESGRFSEAVTAFESVLRTYPGAPAAAYSLLARARMYERLDREDDAIKDYETVIRSSPKRAGEALLARAALEEKRGNMTAASRDLRLLLMNFPVSPEAKAARQALDSLCAKIMKSCGSSTLFQEVLACGECMMDAGRYQETQVMYEKALKRRSPDEGRLEMLMALGSALDVQEKFSAAEKIYRKVMREAPSTPRAANAAMAIVQGFLDRDRLRQAVRELEGIVKDFAGTPQGAHAQFLIGSCSELLRDYKKAEEAYRKVTEIAPQTLWAVEAQRSLLRLMERRR